MITDKVIKMSFNKKESIYIKNIKYDSNNKIHSVIFTYGWNMKDCHRFRNNNDMYDAMTFIATSIINLKQVQIKQYNMSSLKAKYYYYELFLNDRPFSYIVLSFIILFFSLITILLCYAL